MARGACRCGSPARENEFASQRVRPSRRRPMVIPEQAAQPFTAFDSARCQPHFLVARENPVFHSLMIPFAVIMGKELSNRASQHRLAEEDHPVQAYPP